MRRAALLAAALLLPGTAAAQRPRCGFGEALSALRSAKAAAARPVTSLSDGRARAEGASASLHAATTTLHGCGCARAAQDAADAALLAEAAGQEPSAAAIAARLQRAAFSMRLVRERLAGVGCS